MFGKRFFLIAALVAALSTAGFAYAKGNIGQGQGPRRAHVNAAGDVDVGGPGANFVDADKDGVCDYAGTKTCDGAQLHQQSRVTQNVAGETNAIMTQMQLQSAVQRADCDGDCDDAQLRERASIGDPAVEMAQVRQRQTQNNELAGTGMGENFVDADGDGTCDNVGTGLGRGFADADTGQPDGGASRQQGRPEWAGSGRNR